MTDKIHLSELEKEILKELASKRITCSRSIYVNSMDLARLLNTTHHQSLIWSLRKLVRWDFLDYRRKSGRHTYSLKEKGFLLAQSLDNVGERAKVTVKETTRRDLMGHGVLKTTKKTEITPVPSKLTDESGHSVDVATKISESGNIGVSYSQKNKELEFKDQAG